MSVLALEIGLRLFWGNPFSGESPDRIVALNLNHSNTNLTVDRSAIDRGRPFVSLRTDDRSYIEPASAHANPDTTIVFLGGSTTECSAVDERLRFPVLVGDILARDGTAVNTKNAGRSGNTLHDSLNIFLNHVVYDRPDFVVLMHVVNDIGVLTRDGDYQGRSGHPVRLGNLAAWVAQMASSRSSLVAMIRNAVRKGEVRSDALAGFDRMKQQNSPSLERVDSTPYVTRLRAFVRMARALSIEPILMTEPLSSSTNVLTPGWADLGNQDVFNQHVRRVANEEGVFLIDLVMYLQEQVPHWDEPGVVFYDGMHVNDEGSRIYARYIAEQLATRVDRIDLPHTDTSKAPVPGPER
jgi:lysophospholipase L1-like esterase